MENRQFFVIRNFVNLTYSCDYWNHVFVSCILFCVDIEKTLIITNIFPYLLCKPQIYIHKYFENPIMVAVSGIFLHIFICAT